MNLEKRYHALVAVCRLKSCWKSGHLLYAVFFVDLRQYVGLLQIIVPIDRVFRAMIRIRQVWVFLSRLRLFANVSIC